MGPKVYRKQNGVCSPDLWRDLGDWLTAAEEAEESLPLGCGDMMRYAVGFNIIVHRSTLACRGMPSHITQCHAQAFSELYILAQTY